MLCNRIKSNQSCLLFIQYVAKEFFFQLDKIYMLKWKSNASRYRNAKQTMFTSLIWYSPKWICSEYNREIPTSIPYTRTDHKHCGMFFFTIFISKNKNQIYSEMECWKKFHKVWEKIQSLRWRNVSWSSSLIEIPSSFWTDSVESGFWPLWRKLNMSHTDFLKCFRDTLSNFIFCCVAGHAYFITNHAYEYMFW